MAKSYSARASQNPIVVEELFGTPNRATHTVRALIEARRQNQPHFEANGLRLTTNKPKTAAPKR